MSGAIVSYSMDQFLVDLAKNNSNPDDMILGYLSNTDTAELGRALARLDRVRAIDCALIAKNRSLNSVRKKKTKKQLEGIKSAWVGKIFEEIVRILLDGCICLSHGGNVRTSTSEIDFLLKMNSLSMTIPIFIKAVTHILGEAKCYTSGVKTEWINELVGLMKIHSATHSILFLASPSKTLPVQHRHAIHYHSGQGSVVVPFGLAQLKQISAGKNFLRVLSDQYIDAMAGSTNLAI